jgi:HEPN superfamily AbiU2-like protein
VQGTAPTFFGVMSEGGLVMAQMCLARLYDKHRGTVTIGLLFVEANRAPGAFKKADATQVARAVRDSRVKVAKLASVLSAIKHRRDTWFAHTDPRAVNDPTTHQAKAELTVEQLQHAFTETESIIQEFGYLLDGSIGPIRFLGGDDYKNLFEIIRRATGDDMRRFDEAFKEQFGHPPPKD